MIDVLTSIWREVLRKPDIRVDDNFFQLGGDARLAMELSHEIDQRLERYVAPAMFFNTPTIASLAAALQSSEFPSIPQVITLRSGDAHTPLFVAHGAGGSVLEFLELAKRIESGRPVYGLLAKGSDGASAPLDHVEDMADYHLRSIRRLQPRGPYFLVGHSLGGLVALEIARRVLESGENPGVLVLVDSYPHLRHLAPPQQLRLVARLAVRRVFGTPESHKGERQPGRDTASSKQLPSVQPITRRIRECDYKALERYRPRFYAGRIHFVRASVASIFPDDPAAVWSKFARQFQLETISGDHFEMLTIHAATLAAMLSRYACELRK